MVILVVAQFTTSSYYYAIQCRIFRMVTITLEAHVPTAKVSETEALTDKFLQALFTYLVLQFSTTIGLSCIINDTLSTQVVQILVCLLCITRCSSCLSSNKVNLAQTEDLCLVLEVTCGSCSQIVIARELVEHVCTIERTLNIQTVNSEESIETNVTITIEIQHLESSDIV